MDESSVTTDLPLVEVALQNRLFDRPVLVSYTAWTRWHDCPLREALFRVGVPRQAKPVRDYLTGNVVHKIMAWVMRTGQLPTNAMVAEVFIRETTKPGFRWHKAGEGARLMRYTAAVVAQMAPFVLRQMQKGELLSETEIYADIPFSGDFAGSFRMTAKLDFWLMFPKTHVILDFKSGTNPRLDKRQLDWYAAVWDRSFNPKGRHRTMNIRTAWVHPHTDGLQVVKHEVTRASMDEAIRLAEEVARSLQTGKTPAKPLRSKCLRCRVRPGCSESAVKTSRGRQVA